MNIELRCITIRWNIHTIYDVEQIMNYVMTYKNHKKKSKKKREYKYINKLIQRSEMKYKEKKWYIISY